MGQRRGQCVGQSLGTSINRALDGDDDPGSAPHTELLVQSIPADEYLERLAKTRAGYVYQAQGTLQ